MEQHFNVSCFLRHRVFLTSERLSQKDAVIIQALTEKLQLFTEIAESVGGLEDTSSRSRLLLRGDGPDLQQGETLLKGAITEGRTRREIAWLHDCVYILHLDFVLMHCSLQLCSTLGFVTTVNFQSVQLRLCVTIHVHSVENLQNLLQSGVRDETPTSRLEEGNGSGVLPRRADTFGGYDSSPTIFSKSESNTLLLKRLSSLPISLQN